MVLLGVLVVEAQPRRRSPDERPAEAALLRGGLLPLRGARLEQPQKLVVVEFPAKKEAFQKEQDKRFGR